MPKKTTRRGLLLGESTSRKTDLGRTELDWVQKAINLQDIDRSPYQRRRYFDEDKLKELAASIQRDGLIEPIVVRPKSGRYELIAGERRLRAIRDYTEMNTIQTQVVHVGDLQARRMSAAENMQREDLSAIEAIEASVEIVDAELIEDIAYSSMAKLSMDRVKTLLAKLDSVRRSEERRSKITEEVKDLSHKFMGQVEQIFKKLPKPLEWRSFYNNDLPLLMDFCEEVREISIRQHLNKSQTRALEKLKEASEEEFQKIVTPVCCAGHSTGRQDQTPLDQESERPARSCLAMGGEIDKDTGKISIRDLSAREIKEIADKAGKKEILVERNRPRISPSLNLKIKILLMSGLGLPVHRVAARLRINRKTVLKYYDNPDLVQSIQEFLEKGLSVSEIAEKHWYPEPLVWSIALEAKTDQERFQALNWGLRTWDHWYWNDVDHRFGDSWPGQIPAQLVAHTLFYFTQEGNLVFDPMAGGGVVPDTCLAFHRKCWSFDLDDRPETRPEIEPYQWNPESLLWPVPPKGRLAGKGKEKPDLIFFDPPYFSKLADKYTKESISSLSRKDYLRFFQEFFPLAKEHSKSSARIAFLNADWRDFQGVSALEEDPGQSIRIDDYIDLLKRSGWEITHIIDCPMSTQRFRANIVSQMQKNRTLGVVRRSLIIGKKK